MFSSSRKRHSLISGGVRIDALGSVDRFAEVFRGVFAFLLYVAHLSRVIVVVCQRVIDIGHVEVVSIGNGFGVFTALFDEGVHLTDADSAAADMGFAHQIAFDPPGVSLRYT